MCGSEHWKTDARKLARVHAVMNDPTPNVTRLCASTGVICHRSTRTETFEIARANMYNESAE